MCNEIQLLENKIDFNNRKMKNHPHSTVPQEDTNTNKI